MPSPYDIWATDDLAQIIKNRQKMLNGIPKCAFLISRVIHNAKNIQDCIETLEDFELPILKQVTTQRVIYADTARTGATVFSETPNPAMKEILSIREEIKEICHAKNTA